MNTFWCLLCLSLTLGQYYADCAQILAFLPLAAKSHWNVLDVVLQTLVARGHNVTAITPFPKTKPVANYTELDTSSLVPSGISVPWDKIMGECSVANNLPFLSGRHRYMCETIFAHEGFWQTINTNK